MNDMAKIFWTGRSQAIRLPKEYRFEGTAVRIRREGGKVVLEPIEGDDRLWAEQMAGMFDEDFARAVLDGRPASDETPAGPSFD